MESSSVLLLFLTIKEFCPHSVVFFFNLFVFETDFGTVVGSKEFMSFFWGDRGFFFWMQSWGFRLRGLLMFFFESFQKILFEGSILLHVLTSFLKFLYGFDPSFHYFIDFVHGLLEKVLLFFLPLLIWLSQALILSLYLLFSWFTNYYRFIDRP